MEKEEMVVGVVYEAGLDECFYAWKEGGAYLNKKRISVSNRPTVADRPIHGVASLFHGK
jgi:myo-inositol-1(or 4)-monophosphatase